MDYTNRTYAFVYTTDIDDVGELYTLSILSITKLYGAYNIVFNSPSVKSTVHVIFDIVPLIWVNEADVAVIDVDTVSEPVISEFPFEWNPFFIINSFAISFPYPRLC